MDKPAENDSSYYAMRRCNMDSRLYCGLCGLGLVEIANNYGPEIPGIHHAPKHKDGSRHSCIAGPAMIKRILIRIAESAGDELFAAGNIDATAKRILLYFQERLLELQKHIPYYQESLNELADEYRTFSDNEKDQDESEKWFNTGPVWRNFLDGYISAKMTRNERGGLLNRNWNDEAEYYIDAIKSIEYNMDRCRWTEDELKHYLRTRIVPKQKSNESPWFEYIDLLDMIIKRVNIFDEYMEIIFHSTGESAEHGKDNAPANAWRTCVPFTAGGGQA